MLFREKLRTCIVVICLAVLFLTGLTAIYFYKNRHPAKTIASLQFQQFEPKVLPNGVKVHNKRLYAYTDSSNKLKDLIMYLDLNLPDSSNISEEKLEGSTISCQSRIIDKETETCELKKTPKGQEYTHLWSRHKAKSLNGEEIRFVKNGTFIFIRTNTGEGNFFPEKQWQSTIDSFVPVDYDLKPEYIGPAV